MQLAGPFLVIGEIEGYLRMLVHNRLDVEDFAGLGEGRNIAGVADLTLGDYCRLLQDGSLWNRLNVGADPSRFIEHLDRVREIRNDIMHFSPEEDDPDDMRTLQGFARYLRELLDMDRSS